MGASSMKQQQQGARLPVWLALVGVLSIVSCMHMRSSQHMLQYHQHNSELDLVDSSHSLPVPGCSAVQRPAVALMMVILGHDNETRHDQYWMAVANRRAYAIEHGYPLYLVTQDMASGEHPAWEKLVALQAVFKHSCAEWVWMNDADAYIMTLGLSVMNLAQNPVAQRNPKQLCSTSSPDIIAAGACHTAINTGSMLWRNNNWTQQFVSDAWHSKWIARPANWWDQSAILHMYKTGDSKDHFCIVKQRALNAFVTTERQKCHDGGGTFQEGDLMVHFAGRMKKVIANMDSKWLQAVPLLPSSLEAASAQGTIFTVTRYSPAMATKHGQRVAVSLRSQLYAKESSMPQDFELYIQPQLEGFSNWGWPIYPAPPEHHAIVARQKQMAQRQQMAWQQQHRR